MLTKGWKMEAVAAEIASKPELAEYELPAPTLQRHSQMSRKVPPPIAALIEDLKPAPDREYLTEIVEAGLRVIRA